MAGDTRTGTGRGIAVAVVAVLGLLYLSAQVTDNGEKKYKIVLEAGFVPIDPLKPLPEDLRVDGHHNQAPVQLELHPGQKPREFHIWKSESFEAVEGDKVSVGIDAARRTVRCRVFQDDKLVKAGPESKFTVGTASCLWVVQPVLG